MAIVNVDLTKPFVLTPATYVAKVTKADIITPAVGDLNDKGNQKLPYINIQYNAVGVPEGDPSVVFDIISYHPSQKNKLKAFVDACSVPFDEHGFDLDLCLAKDVNIDVGVKDDPSRGPQNYIIKVSKI